MKCKLKTALWAALIAVNGSAYAIDPIPAEPGWSGFVTFGLGSMNVETNMVAGIDTFGVEIGKSTISSLDDEPDSESLVLPQVNLNLEYTFEGQTQVFFGNSIEDIVQLDTASIGGVRQQFADRSILAFSLVSTPMLSPVQVWKDPYVTNVKRRETDRTSRGWRIEYDKILGSGFGVQYTSRETELDDELSGTTQLGLSPAQAELLKREGDVTRLAGYYRFKPVGRNVFELQLGFRTSDLDGEAMSGDQDEIQLTWAHLGERFVVATSAFIWQMDYDEVNPVFGKTRDDDTTGLAVFLFDKHLFESKNWWGQASAVWVEQDSNIDFYSSSSTILGLGVQYRL
jgi:hypothetical protein